MSMPGIEVMLMAAGYWAGRDQTYYEAWAAWLDPLAGSMASRARMRRKMRAMPPSTARLAATAAVGKPGRGPAAGATSK
jgi:hypothetical protein